MAMRRWFCNSGLGPAPSEGPTASENGKGLEEEQERAAASIQTSKGLATVTISPKKNTPTAAMTARAPRSKASGRSWRVVTRRHTA